jgi:hypothetical protein
MVVINIKSDLNNNLRFLTHPNYELMGSIKNVSKLPFFLRVLICDFNESVEPLVDGSL